MDSPQPSADIFAVGLGIVDIVDIDIPQPGRTEFASISQPERAEVAGISQPEREVAGISQPEREVAGIPQPEREIAGFSEPESRHNTVSRKPEIVGKASKSSKGEKKNSSRPSTSEMVVESIKSLKKRKGATEEAISKYIEDNYDVNIKVRSRHIKQFLINGVEKGLLEKVGGDEVIERFKIKKESPKKATEMKRNLTEETKKVKKVKKATAALEKRRLEKDGENEVKEKLKKENAKKATGEKRNLAQQEPKNVKKVKKSTAAPEKGLLEKNGRDGVKERFKVKKESAKKTNKDERNFTKKQNNVKKVKKTIAVPGKEAKQ